jgi:hypothetical protein
MLDAHSLSFSIFCWIGIFTFCSFVVGIIFHNFKVHNLGYSLALGYSIAVIFAIITIYIFHIEDMGGIFLGLSLLGSPATFLSNFFGIFINYIFELLGFYKGMPLSEGISLVICGGAQCYFIGYLIQNIIYKKAQNEGRGKSNKFKQEPLKFLILFLVFNGVFFSQLLLESYLGDRIFINLDLIFLKCFWFVLGLMVIYKVINYILPLRNHELIQWVPDRLQLVFICFWLILLIILTWRIFWPQGYAMRIEPLAALGAFIIMSVTGIGLIWFLQGRGKNTILVKSTVISIAFIFGILVYLGLNF